MAHGGSVMAAFQEGETRFLFARYRSGEPVLYELANGTAAAVRKYVKAELYCPVPDCPTPEITTVNRKKYRQGFKHMVASTAHAPESIFHIEGKAQIAKWVRSILPDATVIEEQASNSEHERIADVMVSLADGKRIAIEIQYAALTPDAWQVRHDSYCAQGIRDVWLFGHRGAQMKPGMLPNQVKLNPTHEAVAAAGMPILWFNPEKLQVASAFATDFAGTKPVRICAAAGVGKLIVEDLDKFSLTVADGLRNERLTHLIETTVAWTAQKIADEAAELAAAAAEVAAAAEELAEQAKQAGLQKTLEASNEISRSRLAERWPTTIDGRAIIALFDGAIPKYLNVETSGVDIPVPNIMWQAFLFLTAIEPLLPGATVMHHKLGPAIQAEFGLDIPSAAALRITVAWCEGLKRAGILTPGRDRGSAEYSVDLYRKPLPPLPAGPRIQEITDAPDRLRTREPAAPERSFQEAVRAAFEAEAKMPTWNRMRATHCQACGGRLDPMLGLVTDYHVTCDPQWTSRRRAVGRTPHT